MQFIKTLLTTVSVLLAVAAPSALASDHIDGPVTMEHRPADIVDLFAFKSPEDSEKIVVVMNSYPGLLRGGHFAEEVKYKIIIKNLNVVNGTSFNKFATGEEAYFLCTFKTPHSRNRGRTKPKHSVSCETSEGDTFTQYVGDTTSPASDKFRVFVGPRSDPFFFNAGWAKAIAEKGVIQTPKDSNIMDLINTLSIVIEFKPEDLMGPNVSPLLGFVAQTRTRDEGQTEDRLLDRVGRPEITNVSMVSHKGESELRDLYNQEDPFALKPKHKAWYHQRLVKNIGFYDDLDGSRQWSPAKKSAFADLLLEDYLVFDWTKPCDRFNYLDIEMAMLRGKAHSTCGGRTLTDDIMDRLFTVYVNGGHGPRIADGVYAPHKQPQNTFPYLSPAKFTILGTKKVLAARLIGAL